MLSLPNDVREAENEGGRKVLQQLSLQSPSFCWRINSGTFVRTAPFLVLLQGSSIDLVPVEPKCSSISEHSGSLVNYTEI